MTELPLSDRRPHAKGCYITDVFRVQKNKKAMILESNESKKESGCNLSEGTEKGEFEVNDLVWGKVKSHPWWPGMICDPSGASNKSMEYFKEGGLLVAYFGDQTFAWNEMCNVKPFCLSFGEMAEQSDGEVFCRGVEGALREVGRRVECGLACLCVSEEVYKRIKEYGIVNPGVKKEFSRVEGGDRFSTVECFKPVKAVDCVRDLAIDPFGVSRLDVTTVGCQLSAFNRWKGCHQLQVDDLLDESDDKFDDHGSEVKKGNSNAFGMGSSKRKRLFNGHVSASKKVKWLSELMPNVDRNLSDDEYIPKKRGRKRKVIESNHSCVESRSQTKDEFLSQIWVAAINPTAKHHNLDSLVKFSSDFRNYRMKEEKNNVDQIVTSSEVVDTDGFTGIKDSYWTDRIIETNSDLTPRPNKEDSPTSLTFKFTKLDSAPSLKKMNEIFRQFGPLQEEETRVLKKKNCVKLVYERRSDAETAFSSSGKFSIFGPALVSYCLNYKPTPRKTVTARKKGEKSAKTMQSQD